MNNASVHISTWPSEPVRVPPLLSGPVDFDEEWLYFDRECYQAGPGRQYAELPDGTHLHELPKLDLTSSEAVARFIERFGYPGSDAYAQGPPWYELQEDWRRVGRDWVPADLPTPATRPAVSQSRLSYPLAEFRERAGLVIALSEIYAYLRGSQTLTETALRWPACSLVTPVLPTHDYFVLAFRVVGNWALEPFQPVFEITTPAPGRRQPGPLFEQVAGSRRPRLFEALFLQLFNDVVASVEYRRCARKTCGRWFNGDRTNKRFCDFACAKAEAQRQLQYRKSAKWRTQARRFAIEAQATRADMSATELLEMFGAAYPSQPYNTSKQFEEACKEQEDKPQRKRPK